MGIVFHKLHCFSMRIISLSSMFCSDFSTCSSLFQAQVQHYHICLWKWLSFIHSLPLPRFPKIISIRILDKIFIVVFFLNCWKVQCSMMTCPESHSLFMNLGWNMELIRPITPYSLISVLCFHKILSLFKTQKYQFSERKGYEHHTLLLKMSLWR